MSDWIAQHFLHPSYVLPWGAALASVPIIVHLINRLRYRRVRFAAMEFLLKSQQRNRRRLMIEQLLLLLLRIAIVAGILLLISRLVLDPSALWAFRGGKSHHVVLLDDSGSMRDRWGETSAFKEGLAIVRRLAAEGARRPGTQQCTLILLSQPDHPLFQKRDVNNAFVVEMENAFERLECKHESLDLVTGVDAAAKLISQDAATVRHLHIVSDFRAKDWRDRQALRAAFLAAAKTGASIDLAKTVGETHDNLAITDLGGEIRAAAVGVPVRLSVTVRNFGSKVAQNVRLAILADGVALARSVEIDKLEAGQQDKRETDVTFKKPGKHTVEVQLPDDALSADNKRVVAVDINVANPVLIIDGDPESDDGYYVSTALSADSSITGYSTRIESADFLRHGSLDQFRCIYMLNVRDIPADAVEILGDYVRRGGGLVWFLGDVVNTSFYNEVLYPAGGLFPVRLGRNAKQAVRADETSLAPDLTFTNNPIFSVYKGGESNPFVEDVRIQTWIPVADDWVRDDNQRKDPVSTIAYLPGHEPFAFEGKIGKGHVAAFLTSAGPKWNTWSRNPSVVVFQLELVKHLAREDQAMQRRIVGEPIQVSYDPAEYLETVEITAPDANGKRVTRLTATRPPGADKPSADPTPPTGTNGQRKSPKPRQEAIRVSATYADTDRPGVYVVRLFKDQAAAPEEQWIAYNVPADESDLKLATNAEILARLTNAVHVQIHEPGQTQWIEGHSASQEARTLLLFLLAVALVVEQFFAHRLSHLPARAGGPA
jgi:Aerotolerance regulator N-terminal/CARDB